MPVHPAGRHRHAFWGEFLALPENRSALRAVRLLSGSLLEATPRPSLLPLVLHGPSGSGKSHLVNALIEKLSEAAKVVTIQYVPAMDFTRSANASGEQGQGGDESLKACDLLVIEDFHLLPAKAAEEACDLLDHRTARRRATVVVMNVGPASLVQLPRRLTSRLTAGLVVPLDPLSPASRKRLLKAEAKRRGVRLAADALEWLASRATGGGIRPLLGTLHILATFGHNPLTPLDRTQVETLLAAAGEPLAVPVTPEQIVRRVAAEFGVAEKDLLGPSRLRQVRISRQVAMYLVRQMTGLSLPRTGEIFGGRDHTTVLHSCRKVAEEIDRDELFAGRVRELHAQLR